MQSKDFSYFYCIFSCQIVGVYFCVLIINFLVVSHSFSLSQLCVYCSKCFFYSSQAISYILTFTQEQGELCFMFTDSLQATYAHNMGRNALIEKVMDHLTPIISQQVVNKEPYENEYVPQVLKNKLLRFLMSSLCL